MSLLNCLRNFFKLNKKANFTCPICLIESENKAINNEFNYCVLLCGHVFCLQCFHLFKDAGYYECPLCRAFIEAEFILKSLTCFKCDNVKENQFLLSCLHILCFKCVSFRERNEEKKIYCNICKKKQNKIKIYTV